MPNEPGYWTTPEHALKYLREADSIPHRTEGEATLLEFVPADAGRVLDLGSGDGRLLRLVRSCIPQADFVALDFSPTMIQQLEENFASDKQVQVGTHDLENPLPALGDFDLVVSSFAIHHLVHERKRSLYEEVYSLLRSGGIFCNLEHVASPSERLHLQFLEKIG